MRILKLKFYWRYQKNKLCQAQFKVQKNNCSLTTSKAHNWQYLTQNEVFDFFLWKIYLNITVNKVFVVWKMLYCSKSNRNVKQENLKEFEISLSLSETKMTPPPPGWYGHKTFGCLNGFGPPPHCYWCLDIFGPPSIKACLQWGLPKGLLLEWPPSKNI